MQIDMNNIDNSQSNLTKVSENTTTNQGENISKSIEEKSSLKVPEDKLTLDGEEREEDEKSVYKQEDEKVASSSSSSDIDNLLEQLKKQLQKLQEKLKATDDEKEKQAITQQISDIQARIMELLQRAVEEAGG